MSVRPVFKNDERLIFRDLGGYRFFLMSFEGRSAKKETRGQRISSQTLFMIVYRMVKYTIEEVKEDVYDGH